MKTPRVFRRNQFARHPPSRPRCLRKPRHPSCMERAFARGVLPRAFVCKTSIPVPGTSVSSVRLPSVPGTCGSSVRLWRNIEPSISAFEPPILQPTPQRTCISCMHDPAINDKKNPDTTACCGSVSKEPILSLGAD